MPPPQSKSPSVPATEDTIHALWGCQSLLVIWDADEDLRKLLRYNFNVFADLLEMAFLMKNRIDVDLLALMFRLIWNNI